MYLTLIPAYGRDYKNKTAAITDWVIGKDFIIANVTHPYDGKPCSIWDIETLKNEGFKGVNLRYNKLTQVAVINF